MNNFNKLKSVLALSVLASFATGCLFSEEEQFTKKLEAPAFVTELYGTTKQTIALSHEDGAHISWMGLVESNDYTYFKMTKIQVGNETVVADGIETDGTTYTAASNAIIKDITVDSSDDQNEFTNGSISLASSNDLKITIEYSPLIAVDSEEKPHEAYLLINYDSPRLGTARVSLQGFTQGVKDEKCTQDVGTMEAIDYKVTGSAFDLYFCSGQVAAKGQNNDTTHGASTNLATITLTDDIITFYQADAETVCLLSEPEPSIPDFVLPIPEGLAPISTMDISMVDGSYAECSIDGDGNILCADNIQIKSLVSMSGFSMSTAGFSADELVTDDCPDFGAISGAGGFGEATMSVILKGTTLQDQNTEEYDIIDSLVIANIEMEKQ